MKLATRREKATIKRRRQIVESAVKCFAEKGFHQTSMRDLAGHAGVSLGNLYNHFENKSELIAEIASLESDGLEAFISELAAIRNPVKALEHFVLHYADYCADPENALLSAEILTEAMRNPGIGTGFAENRKQLTAVLTTILEKIGVDRKVTTRVAPSDTADFLLDLVEGYAMRLTFTGSKLGKREFALLNDGVRQLAGI